MVQNFHSPNLMAAATLLPLAAAVVIPRRLHATAVHLAGMAAAAVLLVLARRRRARAAAVAVARRLQAAVVHLAGMAALLAALLVALRAAEVALQEEATAEQEEVVDLHHHF